ncbi:MAG: S-methyl-5-thioribose-1-phosphate isomerase [Ignavibacteriales bacterium]|nr:MAG: S-methyl-5-thioribose-1-phosphate isomerase [Ignavibacteriales bacterium]
MKNNFTVLNFVNDELVFINQAKLPLIEEYITTDNVDRIAEAIERLEIRGAPAIGVAAAYALALSLKNNVDEKIFNSSYERLKTTRPTAVNLFWALNEIKSTYDKYKDDKNVYEKLIKRAVEIHNEDIRKCDAMAENGLIIFKKHSRVLTHCNAGALATSGNGTALNVIKKGFDEGLVDFVYVDETRPLFQGSRLTAFELDKAGIPFSIITDSTAAFLMQQKKIDLAVVGADRIASNGDSANKIGTYSVAVNCFYHNIPFYIAAPTTTIDKNCKSGEEIKIELRGKQEITHFKSEQITNENYDVYSPAFDVTPAKLITSIITDLSVYYPPYNF